MREVVRWPFRFVPQRVGHKQVSSVDFCDYTGRHSSGFCHLVAHWRRGTSKEGDHLEVVDGLPALFPVLGKFQGVPQTAKVLKGSDFKSENERHQSLNAGNMPQTPKWSNVVVYRKELYC